MENEIDRVPVVWVKLVKYCSLVGETKAAVYCRRRDGKWLDGIHTRVVDGSLWVNLIKAQQWVETCGKMMMSTAS